MFKIVASLALATAAATITSPGNGLAAEGPTAAEVQAAKSAADHEALAKEYDAKAAEARASAAEHRKMGEAYKGATATEGGKTGGGSAMPQHCKNLAESYDKQAQMYADMAATERQLAKASGK